MDPPMDLTRDQVLTRDIPWENYLNAKLISSTDLQLLRRYDHKPEDAQIAMLEENGVAYVRVFLRLLDNITKEETVEYVVALVDEMLSVDPIKHAALFHDEEFSPEEIYRPFLSLLSRKNWFLQEKACKILTVLISARPRQQAVEVSQKPGPSKNVLQDVLQKLVSWLCIQLRHPSHPSRAIPTAVSSLATLLRDHGVKSMFVQLEGVKLLTPLISPATTQQYIQLLYEATLCMWLLSFYSLAVDAIAATRALPRLVEVARTSSKEKVVRVVILTLRNLLTKGTFARDMVELGMPKIIQNLKMQAWSDEDLTEALNFMEETLKKNLKLLSSFEKYKQEVLSGNLDWTPMHKDPLFWKENIKKFEENDFQVLRILVTILDNSRDPRTQAVACQDIAQFIQFHPAGRGIVLDMRAKDRVMRLMNHDNSEVRKEALICVQKLLLNAKYASFMQNK
ncbi:hypothetical protein SELMODRAFT_141399 [Selaginella moellendorffii]|uniref:V-type proton ATPase subunit H n=1 Tax=Selaginella moellendorffii TaxID=88036 RepID=D8QW38_SELML|nr:probable V-type proton ATPase subunit H [Selaginella moellendorffii]EFJ36565.1 hypothetical protein SELMODRAFT_141399 [Selaginella moellendorffii]|eukprot:XP_002963102.1 probable V-type proton ATPase subunit H [Selaginella moellendorffii]